MVPGNEAPSPADKTSSRQSQQPAQPQLQQPQPQLDLDEYYAQERISRQVSADCLVLFRDIKG